MCGFDGALGRYPVGIEAAHVRWHSQQGPDEIARNEADLAVDALAGQPLLIPRPHQPAVDVIHISWHHHQVFKGAYHVGR